MNQIERILYFTETHEALVNSVSHYILLDNSEAIEIHYKNGMIQVWSERDDLFITVKDPVV